MHQSNASWRPESPITTAKLQLRTSKRMCPNAQQLQWTGESKSMQVEVDRWARKCYFGSDCICLVRAIVVAQRTEASSSAFQEVRPKTKTKTSKTESKTRRSAFTRLPIRSRSDSSRLASLATRNCVLRSKKAIFNRLLHSLAFASIASPAHRQTPFGPLSADLSAAMKQ